MVQMSGREFKAFYLDTNFWPEAAWHEDEVGKVDGISWEVIDLESISDTANVAFEGGFVASESPWFCNGLTLDDTYQQWLKLRTGRSVVVIVPKDTVERLAEFVRQIGGEIHM